jgi:hypothetical protein
MMRESHVDGASFLSTRLLGTEQLLDLADTVVLSLRTFEQDIRDEKDEERYVVIAAMHVKIFLQSLNPCIANICPFYMSVWLWWQDEVLTIKEGKQKQHKQWRQDMEITFPQQLLFCYRIDMRSSSVVDDFDFRFCDAGLP